MQIVKNIIFVLIVLVFKNKASIIKIMFLLESIIKLLIKLKVARFKF